MDLWNLQIPVPVALALVAAIGYLVSRMHRPADSDMVVRSARELKRAQTVATELEKIAWTIRQSLAKHHASVSQFKERVSRLHDNHHEAAWKELCREVEDILKPTLQLAMQIANAYDEIRQQTANLMTFTEVRTDPLTGVNNRRGLDDALSTQFALMTRYDAIFSLVDVRHRPLQAGQRPARTPARRSGVARARPAVRPAGARDDILARYGGEEFVVVMPHTDLAGANIFAERLRAEVAESDGDHRQRRHRGGQAGDTQESLIARADAALYTPRVPAAIACSATPAWTPKRSTPNSPTRRLSSAASHAEGGSWRALRLAACPAVLNGHPHTIRYPSIHCWTSQQWHPNR